MVFSFLLDNYNARSFLSHCLVPPSFQFFSLSEFHWLSNSQYHSVLWSYVPFSFQQWLWQSFVKLPIYIWYIFNFNVNKFQKIYSNCGTYLPLSFVYACRDVCTEQDIQCILTRRQSQHMRAFTCSPEFISACYNRKPLYAFRGLNCQALIKTKKRSDPLTIQKTQRVFPLDFLCAVTQSAVIRPFPWVHSIKTRWKYLLHSMG